MKAQGWSKHTNDGRKEVHIKGEKGTSIHIIGSEFIVSGSLLSFLKIAEIRPHEIKTLAKGDLAKEKRDKQWRKNLTDGQMQFPK